MTTLHHRAGQHAWPTTTTQTLSYAVSECLLPQTLAISSFLIPAATEKSCSATNALSKNTGSAWMHGKKSPKTKHSASPSTPNTKDAFAAASEQKKLPPHFLFEGLQFLIRHSPDDS